MTARPAQTDALGARHAARRDWQILDWLREAASNAPGPVRVLDVGCSYGHLLLRLNAELGNPADVELIGIDLHPAAIGYANAFARRVFGYQNCSFQVADVTRGLPFEDASFAVITMADVVEHLHQPVQALTELARVARHGATLVISTPLRDGLFKRAAAIADRASSGRISRAYYLGKGSELDAAGQPLMDVYAGHGHVSEMNLPELIDVASSAGWRVSEITPMSVMSGSAWFDRHPPILATLLLLEWLHDKFRRVSWAHSVLLRLTKAGA